MIEEQTAKTAHAVLKGAADSDRRSPSFREAGAASGLSEVLKTPSDCIGRGK